jgi:hypothetical protein
MKKISLLLVTLSFITSCTPIEKEIQLMPIDYLTAGLSKTWKLPQFKNAEIDQLTDCIKDDTFTFKKKAGEYEWKKGESKCYTEDVDAVFSYKLTADGSALTINEYEYKVNRLDMKNLEIEIVLNGHKQILGYSTVE